MKYIFARFLSVHVLAPVGESHVALAEVSVVHGEGCRDDVGRVSALLTSNLHVFAQQWAIVGVSDGDERLGFLRSTLVAQVGNAVFRHDGVNVVLCVIDVRAEWHDA